MRRSREGHRRERKGLTCRTNLLNSHLGHKFELAVTGGFEACGVEGDSVMLFRFEAEDLGGDVLDCVEEFAIAGQEEGSIGAGEFDGNFGSGFGRGRAFR